MEKERIFEMITTVFKRTLRKSDLELTRETTAKDVMEWDSLTHIQLIVAIEKEFKINFTSLEIQNFKNIGDIVDTVYSKF